MPLFDNIEGFKNVDPALQWAIFIVGCLIVVAALVAGVVSIWLAIKYMIYNRTMNKAGINGEQTARKILDSNGLNHIKVSVVGSLMFGNSYSHFFKKVRLRRWTVKKNSISSMAMGAQKASLALLDKEGDKDMKTRIILTPFIYFGPIAFIPSLLVGVILDIVLFNFTGVATIIAASLGILFYVASFVMSLMVLKTEVKAQTKALQILEKEQLATEEERNMMKSLFKLYNIQYVNDLILQFLELILRILMLFAKIQNTSNSSSD
ncbi:MAG: zinc metallopeptidase [Bacilli bacterium]|nr:zinc metallopeptidase [Bacilli bacterium]